MNPSIKTHWEKIYAAGDADSVSWFQSDPTPSLDLIVTAGVAPDAAILDVGGGASLLVDRLLDRGFSTLSVLDVSGQALAMAKARLGPRAASVCWVEADATAWEPPAGEFGLWHDRAVFHFLTDAADRDAELIRRQTAGYPTSHHPVCATNGPGLRRGKRTLALRRASWRSSRPS